MTMALGELRRNTLRSALTTLGVVIGVGSVIAMLTLGEGAKARVTADISGLGENLLVVVPGSARRSWVMTNAPPLSIGDARAMENELAGVGIVAPSSGRPVQAVHGNRNAATVVTGTENGYLEIRSWTFTEGRRFTDGELLSGTPVCILGRTVRDKLFEDENPIGATIRVANVSCRVVGSLDPKGRSTFGDDQDNFLIMPLRAFHRRIAGDDAIGAIWVSAAEGYSTVEVQREIETLMRQRRRIGEGEDDNVIVRDMKEISQLLGKATGVLQALLGAIAAVSLFVGGIGIMNIMLVSVTERTREIGIRLAIGAREQDVLMQFLVEATTLSTFGGILGIALGLGGSYAAARGLDLPFIFLPQIVGLAFVFSAIVGIAFGFLPARKAARLNPIDALRHE